MNKKNKSKKDEEAPEIARGVKLVDIVGVKFDNEGDHTLDGALQILQAFQQPTKKKRKKRKKKKEVKNNK